MPRFIDCLRILWWTERGYWHGARKGSTPSRALSLGLAIGWWPAYPLLAIAQLISVYRTGTVYYMSTEKDAVLAISVTRKGWHVGNHSSALPGTGQGKKLRLKLFPYVAQEAQSNNIPIYTTAANKKLAASYKEELPALEDTGPGFPRGRKLSTHPPKNNGLKEVQHRSRVNRWGLAAAGVYMLGTSIPLISLYVAFGTVTSFQEIRTLLTSYIVIGIFLGGAGQFLRTAAHGSISHGGKQVDGAGKIIGLLGWSLTSFASVTLATRGLEVPDWVTLVAYSVTTVLVVPTLFWSLFTIE